MRNHEKITCREINKYSSDKRDEQVICVVMLHITGQRDGMNK
jgi:hypothetical protein